ncbi:MAG: four-helix bundle copper-binding protein [Gemmataceae bacterium]|nr:four-helix bundle copper-binding protein [Gemmataceae bacterium]
MKTKLFGATTVGVAALVAIGFGVLAAQDRPAAANWDNDEHGKHFEACAKVCAECQVACDKNFHHCFTLVEGGKKEHAKAAHVSLDCAELCAAAARLTARHSPLSAAACDACAKACDMCAAECDKFQNMPEMKACADKCRECAKSCREMVKMMGGHDHHEKK